MDKSEFESRMKKLKYKRIHNKLEKKDYCDYYVNSKELNIYGINKEDGKFIAFYKDSERGIVTEIGKYDNDTDAYNNLIEVVEKWESAKKESSKKD